MHHFTSWYFMGGDGTQRSFAPGACFPSGRNFFEKSTFPWHIGRAAGLEAAPGRFSCFVISSANMISSLTPPPSGSSRGGPTRSSINTDCRPPPSPVFSGSFGTVPVEAAPFSKGWNKGGTTMQVRHPAPQARMPPSQLSVTSYSVVGSTHRSSPISVGERVIIARCAERAMPIGHTLLTHAHTCHGAQPSLRTPQVVCDTHAMFPSTITRPLPVWRCSSLFCGSPRL